ncbi:MAG: 2-amino-4-hydroxy-6-hydroxymethyldihydropteridine diphosphokinase [Bacteroidaceae bacterium]|nr:2-amino-4-hydroxy-6-hydroxymethyldihydropteridine diphosphokinase [Bacteroidaceae bacterium]
MKKETLYLSLGTNLGDKKQNILCAIEALSRIFGSPLVVAPIIETEPWGFQSANTFLNTVVAYDTDLSPEEILTATQQVESTLGRTSKSIDGKYSDRPIDIDILLYGNAVIATDELTIPHPLMHKRQFVLQPFAAIAPQVVHPLLHKSIVELLRLAEQPTVLD